jgi:aryl-alcohol dehydrogenase (NADP+)
MQNHYNLVHRDEEREMIPLCRAEGAGVIPYSPLARGFLAGTRSREDWAATLRARTDPYGARDLFRPCDFDAAERAALEGALPAAPRPGLHLATSDGSSLADARGTPRGFRCHSRRAPVDQAPR